jgi:hypothetical protein
VLGVLCLTMLHAYCCSQQPHLLCTAATLMRILLLACRVHALTPASTKSHACVCVFKLNRGSRCVWLAGAILSAVWVANAGVMARGVNWQRFTQQQLLEICECVGGLGLAAVLRLMAEDHAGAAGREARVLDPDPSGCQPGC